jgi:Holliday junction resolvasome RuvABC endonuclease subunit
MSRSLGFDPGLSKGIAWALYDDDADTLEVGTLKLDGGEDSSAYYNMARNLIEETRADVVGIETQYAPRLPATQTARMSKEQALTALYATAAAALKLAYVRGLLAAAVIAEEARLVEVHPTTVKVAITGNGRATKEQVKQMVETLYGKKLGEDRADAAAVAVAALRRA